MNPNEDRPEPETGPSGSSEPTPSETLERLTELEERLRISEKQVALIRQAHAESAAEYERVKDRMRRHQEQELERARLAMAKNLFDVADNFDRVVDAARQGGSHETLFSGVQAVRELFLKSLGDFGLARYGEVGDHFDPNLHEALSLASVAAANLDGTVTAVFMPGYRAGSEVLRAARVLVGKYVAPPEAEPPAEA